MHLTEDPQVDDRAMISPVDGLPGWGVTLVTLGAVAAVILTGIYATRPVFRYIHHARLREMYTALALLMVVGVAVLMTMVGLSPALGTFLAGVVLANSSSGTNLKAIWNLSRACCWVCFSSLWGQGSILPSCSRHLLSSSG